MSDTDDPRPDCRFMASLVDLLYDLPRRGDVAPRDSLATRLDGLEHEARLHAAPSETIAAIRGVRVLLNLAELPTLAAVEKGRAVMSATEGGWPMVWRER